MVFNIRSFWMFGFLLVILNRVDRVLGEVYRGLYFVLDLLFWGIDFGFVSIFFYMFFLLKYI